MTVSETDISEYNPGSFAFVSAIESYHRPTSRFGRRGNVKGAPGASHFHKGIDLAAPGGSPVYAMQIGRVEKISYNPKLGYTVTINHGWDAKERTIETVYMHVAHVKVREGQAVQQGEQIAEVAKSVERRGEWTGPHLHLEVRIDGKPINPEPYIRPKHNTPMVELASASQPVDNKAHKVPVMAAQQPHHPKSEKFQAAAQSHQTPKGRQQIASEIPADVTVSAIVPPLSPQAQPTLPNTIPLAPQPSPAVPTLTSP